MEILLNAEQFVFNLFKDKLSSEYLYHNFTHTLNVVLAVDELIKGENINDNDATHLKMAAWFHDTGYIMGNANHEENSISVLRDFLNQIPNHGLNIEIIASIIRATKLENVPQTHLEMCLRDADYYHFTKENYCETNILLKKEIEQTCKVEITDEKWCFENFEMLSKKHLFYTNYAKIHWQPKKEKTIFEIYKQLENTQKKDKGTNKEIKKKKLEKLERPERGIDTLFRTTLNNHTQLSAIADSKANILLSVNAIIISIALTAIIPKLDSARNAHLIIPTFILLIFSVVTIVCTILSTKPKVTSGTFTDEDVKKKSVNLLFFGNFYKMPLETYTKAMNDLMVDRDYLYDTLIKDLYYLGLVLDRKYKILRIAYTVFMIGIIVSVSAFIIAFVRL